MHRAVIAAFILAWLFLPVVDTDVFRVAGIKLNKERITSYSLLAAAFLFDRQRLFSFRPKWFDLPMLVYCICPAISTFVNVPPPDGTPLWRDAFSQSLENTMIWGFPYFLGRLYLNEPSHIRDFAIGIVLGGMIYVPLCLLEMRISPMLHYMTYGAYAPLALDGSQAIRWGGYRPVVYMQHGLAVGIWMATATLVAFWLWWTRALDRLPLGQRGSVSMTVVFLILFPSTVLCKSNLSLMLGLLGGIVLFTAWKIRFRYIMLVLVLISPLYIFGRSTAGREVTGWMDYDYADASEQEEEMLETKAMAKKLLGVGSTGAEFDQFLQKSFGERGAQSVIFRLTNEDRLMEKAFQHPYFGWAGWGRERLYDGDGKAKTIADGLWILTLGQRGFVGLIALWMAMLLPAARFFWLQSPRTWGHPLVAPAAVLITVVVMHMIDNLMNAMTNPIFILTAGAMAGWTGNVSQAGPVTPEVSQTTAKPTGRTRSLARPESANGETMPGVLRRPWPTAR